MKTVYMQTLLAKLLPQLGSPYPATDRESALPDSILAPKYCFLVNGGLQQVPRVPVWPGDTKGRVTGRTVADLLVEHGESFPPILDAPYFAKPRQEDPYTFQQGLPNTLGSIYSVYNPRAGIWSHKTWVQDDQGQVILQDWEANLRHLSVSLHYSLPFSKNTFEAIQQTMNELAVHWGLENCPDLQCSQGYPEVLECCSEIRQNASTHPQDIQPGDYIFTMDAYNSCTITQVSRMELVVPTQIVFPSFYRIYARGSDLLGGNSLTMSWDGTNQLAVSSGKPYNNPWGTETFILQLNHQGKYGREGAPDRIWKITQEQAAVFAKYRPAAEEHISGTTWTPNQFSLHLALQALQFMRWGVEDLAMRGLTPTNPEEATCNEQVTSENYKWALAILLSRFGHEEFLAAAINIFQSHIMGIHTALNTSVGIYVLSPHSDIIDPFDANMMRLAYETLMGIHPVPADMGKVGRVANVKTLFGDATFWQILREHEPMLFSALTDYLLSLPADFKVKNYYGKALVNPVALIKQFFPDAFKIIHEARPEFDSNEVQAIQALYDQTMSSF